MRFTTEHAHAILQGSKREHRVRPRTKPYSNLRRTARSSEMP